MNTVRFLSLSLFALFGVASLGALGVAVPAALLQEAPYRHTGRLENSAYFGTAVLAESPHTIATAAHMVYDERGQWRPWMNWRSAGSGDFQPMRTFHLAGGYQQAVANGGARSASAFAQDFAVGYAYAFLAEPGDYARIRVDASSVLTGNGEKLLVGYPGALAPGSDLNQRVLARSGPFTNRFSQTLPTYFSVEDISLGAGGSGGGLWTARSGGGWDLSAIYVSGRDRTDGAARDSSGVALITAAYLDLVVTALGAVQAAAPKVFWDDAEIEFFEDEEAHLRVRIEGEVDFSQWAWRMRLPGREPTGVHSWYSSSSDSETWLLLNDYPEFFDGKEFQLVVTTPLGRVETAWIPVRVLKRSQPVVDLDVREIWYEPGVPFQIAATVESEYPLDGLQWSMRSPLARWLGSSNVRAWIPDAEADSEVLTMTLPTGDWDGSEVRFSVWTPYARASSGFVTLRSRHQTKFEGNFAGAENGIVWAQEGVREELTFVRKPLRDGDSANWFFRRFGDEEWTFLRAGLGANANGIEVSGDQLWLPESGAHLHGVELRQEGIEGIMTGRGSITVPRQSESVIVRAHEGAFVADRMVRRAGATGPEQTVAYWAPKPATLEWQWWDPEAEWWRPLASGGQQLEKVGAGRGESRFPQPGRSGDFRLVVRVEGAPSVASPALSVVEMGPELFSTESWVFSFGISLSYDIPEFSVGTERIVMRMLEVSAVEGQEVYQRVFRTAIRDGDGIRWLPQILRVPPTFASHDFGTDFQIYGDHLYVGLSGAPGHPDGRVKGRILVYTATPTGWEWTDEVIVREPISGLEGVQIGGDFVVTADFLVLGKKAWREGDSDRVCSVLSRGDWSLLGSIRGGVGSDGCLPRSNFSGAYQDGEYLFVAVPSSTGYPAVSIYRPSREFGVEAISCEGLYFLPSTKVGPYLVGRARLGVWGNFNFRARWSPEDGETELMWQDSGAERFARGSTGVTSTQTVSRDFPDQTGAQVVAYHRLNPATGLFETPGNMRVPTDSPAVAQFGLAVTPFADGMLVASITEENLLRVDWVHVSEEILAPDEDGGAGLRPSLLAEPTEEGMAVEWRVPQIQPESERRVNVTLERSVDLRHWFPASKQRQVIVDPDHDGDGGTALWRYEEVIDPETSPRWFYRVVEE